MRRIILALVLLVAVPSVSRASLSVETLHAVNNPSTATTYLATTALNSAASALTFRLTNPGGQYAMANIEITRTRVAGTDLTLTCKSSTTPGGTPTAVRTTCSYDASGVCLSSTATKKSGTSTTETLAWQINIRGWLVTDCTFASTAAGASDFVGAVGNMVSQ